MDIHTYWKYLSEDEKVVEFIIRGINPDGQNSTQLLFKAFENEIGDSKLIPPKSHILEKPELEVGTAREILEQLEKSISSKLGSAPNEVLVEALCRCMHWRRRMERVKTTFGDILNITSTITKFRRAAQLAQNYLDEAQALQQASEPEPKPSPKIGSQISGFGTTDAPVTTSFVLEHNIPPPTFSLAPSGSRYNETKNIWSNPLPFSGPQYTLPNIFAQPPPNVPAVSTYYSFPQFRPAPINDDENLASIARERIPEFGQPIPRHYLPKWRIAFDGTPRGLEVHDFLFRVETFAKRDGYPMFRLPLIIHTFVTDIAEKWLWVYTRNNPDVSWDDLKDAFFARFSDHETERETRRFIERRTQKFRESFNDFALEIQSCNNRITNRFSEIELLEIIRENMNPGLKSATLTMHFESLERLRLICQKFERVWSASGFDPRNQSNYHNQRHTVSEISHPEDGNQVAIVVKNPPDSNNSDVVSAIHTSPTNLICWNCKDIGHRYQDCVKEFVGIFCFGCGKTGVRKPNCGNCSAYSSVNRNPNAVRPGIPRSGNPVLDPRPQPTVSQKSQTD